MTTRRIDKRELPVILFQADGSVMRGVVFLGTGTLGRSGPQTLAGLMHEKDRFLPFRTECGTFCVVNKSTITHLRCPPDDPEPEWSAEDHRCPVQISFAGGEQLCGWIAIARAEGQDRLLDFINASGSFFPLNGGETRYLVNAALIRTISPG